MAYAVYEGNGGIVAGQDYGIAIPYPSGISANDILVVQLLDADADSFTVPTGWSLIAEHTTNSNCSDALMWKRATGGENGTLQVDSLSSAGQLVTGIMSRFSGCITSGVPFEGLQTAGIVNSNSANMPAVTTLGPERLVVNFIQIEDDPYWTAASSYILAFRETTTVGSDAQFYCQYQEVATASTISADTTHASRADYWGSFSIALLPEPISNDVMSGGLITSFAYTGILKGLGRILAEVSEVISVSGILKGRIKIAASSFVAFIYSGIIKSKISISGLLDTIIFLTARLIYGTKIVEGENIYVQSTITEEVLAQSTITEEVLAQSTINSELIIYSPIEGSIIKNKKIMSKIYIDQSYLRIIAETGKILTNSISTEIKYIKPDGIEGSWLGVIENEQQIVYNFSEPSELDQAGLWTFWSYVVFQDGRKAPGEPEKIMVYNEGK